MTRYFQDEKPITQQDAVAPVNRTVWRAKARLIVLLFACLIIAVPAAAQQAPSRGASLTMLPDGSVLIAGGFSSDKTVSAEALIVSPDGTRTKLQHSLNFARAGHTATVLPDGTVFIFGGVDSRGKIVNAAEVFDPATQQFSVISGVLAVPRAFHTATLLTDGTLLLAGGVEAGGEFADDVQLWDYRNRRALSFHALLSTPREGHTAVLLPDGTVRISGGTDHFGKPVAVDEIYDPLTKQFRFADQSSAGQADEQVPLAIAESIPEDGATDVAIDAVAGVRFSRLLNVRTVNQANFTLLGPADANIPVKVTAAESGRLAFVLPSSPLQPGTTYILRINHAESNSGEPLGSTSISFTTAGAPPDTAGPDFVPGPTWTSGTGGSKWQELAPLQASAGETALAGQVLKLNGWPLEKVTIEIDGKKARTDSTGRFLLRGLTAGHHEMWIDGTTANHTNATYGLYPVGVTILAGKTNVLQYTIWMTRIDTAHAVTIPSPTTRETVITNPVMPGLELHLPPNATITDRDGKIVRQVSLTAIPLDKPPFPLPKGVAIPMFFTIQPGGAYVHVPGGQYGSKGARLVYANTSNQPPGMPFDFWNYDPDGRNWFIYGVGRVSADRRSIVPEPGVEFYEFTAPNYGSTPIPAASSPGKFPPAGSKAKDGEPVDLSTGQFTMSKTDLVLPDVVPLTFTRTYISNDSRSRAFGVGATDSYDFFMVGDQNPFTFQELIMPDGGKIRFDRISEGTDADDAIYVAATQPGAFYGAVLSFNTNPDLPGSWTLALKDGTLMNFPLLSGSTTPFCQAVIQIEDRYHNITKIDRNPTTCTIAKITSPNGRSITVTNDSLSRITQITDNSGRTVQYSYNVAGLLASVTDANGGVTSYTYDDQDHMLTITDPKGIVYLTNVYDASDRISQQTQADGSTYLFNWTPAPSTTQNHFTASFGNTDFSGGGGMLNLGPCWGGAYNRYDPNCLEGYMPLVAQVDVTDPRGYVRRVVFGQTGYMTSDTHALGQPEQQTFTYDYYSDNLVKSVTDPLGRVTSFDYDALGNTTRVTRLDGTPNAVTTTFSYGGTFGQLSSVTDPLGHTTSFTYDQNGNLITATDALGHQTSLAYNGAGQLASVTDALSNTVQFGYDGGDLVSITDPLGNMTTQFTDILGRVISRTDAQGNVSKMQYNPLNLLTQVTAPDGSTTSFTYDPNGNLLSLADANSHTTTWTYDNMDRVLTRTDPLLRQESYIYDLNGNLASSTDRKGQVTSLAYDPLNRLKFVGYNTIVNGTTTSYESTTAYTYDAGGRMTQAADSAGGAITDAYDDLDRLTSETTPQGAISYAYDLAGRRTSMTVAGQPQVGYSYDNANRLTQIAQGTSTVSFGYDSMNRRTSLTLSNGVNVSYSYDNDSHVTAINYNFGASALGNLTYSYDEIGRRTLVSGSFARTNLPSVVPSATYDAANELTNWNSTPISYDLNGNMLSDGTNAFTWNARNQVATLNGASLQYDAVGRRIQNATGTSFLYDGANSAQELSAGVPAANLLSGGIDELFSRSDSAGSFTLLTDALGSTIALVDTGGNLATSYSYDPFGNTTVSGAISNNTSQYTGRENEGAGLYFYRARFYNSQLSRFISQDPLGIRGGINSYVYAYENPLSFRDPSGLKGWQDFYNNPVVDFIADHADSLPGICSGGFFGYAGGGPQIGPVYQGTYAFKNWDVDFRDLSHPTVHADPVGVLGEVGAEVPGGEAGIGTVVGRKGVAENFLFVGQKAGPLAAGPLVGASTENGPNPLYNKRYIGLFGEVSNHWTPIGWPKIGPQGAAGGGFYLTVSTAAGCVR